MANGFKALRHVGGGVQRLAELPIDVAAPAIFNGDIVKITAGNLVKASTGNVLIGSFLGCMFVNVKGEQKFSPEWTPLAGSTEIKGLFNDDGNVSYVVESDVTLTVGGTCNVVPGTGNAALGTSTSSVTTGADDFVVKSVVDEAAKIYEVVIK